MKPSIQVKHCFKPWTQGCSVHVITHSMLCVMQHFPHSRYCHTYMQKQTLMKSIRGSYWGRDWANLGWEGQLLGHFCEHRLDLTQLDATSDLEDQPATLHRGHVVVDGPLPAAHALAQAFTSDGFERGPEAPQGEGRAGVHAPVNGETHHLHVTPVQVPATQSLQTQAHTHYNHNHHIHKRHRVLMSITCAQ